MASLASIRLAATSYMVSRACDSLARVSPGNLAARNLMRGRRGAGANTAARIQNDGAELSKTVLAA